MTLLSRRHLAAVVIALLLSVMACVVATSPCPFSLANRNTTTSSSSSRITGSCRCNGVLQEITCSDLAAVPDFSTPADDHYVALYLRRGTITALGPSAFAGLPRLAKIVIDFQPLDAAGGLHEAAFRRDRPASPLRELSIGGTRVRSLPARLLDGLAGLRRLSVWGSEVDRLPGDLFDPVADSLVELALWGNRLERVDGATFDVGGRGYWPALRSLDLDRNAISWLGADAFRATPNVETLRLAGNRVAALPADALAGLGRLRSLRLDHNGLGFVHGTAFAGLDALLSLGLGDNALAFLPDGLFEPLGRLVDLRLQNNRLEYVWWRTFRGLRALRRIDLSGNRLSNLPDDVFRHSTRLAVLSFDGNRLRTLRRCSLPPVDWLPPPPPPPTPSPRPSWRRRRRTLSLLGSAANSCRRNIRSRNTLVAVVIQTGLFCRVLSCGGVN